MVTNKIKLIFFFLAFAIILLGVSSFVALKSIKDTKKENEVANNKIEELKDSLAFLQGSLEDTHNEVENHTERIKKYQEIISAWSKATPNVNEAVKIITASFEDVSKNAHLYPKQKLEGIEDKMMDAVYGAIRSTDPLSIAREFEKDILTLNESRYDNIMKAKIEVIKQNGVTFPEDTKAIGELREYYNSFLGNSDIIESFKESGLDTQIANLEALLDADEESDLAKEFEKAVSAIKTPITLNTSLEKAKSTWEALCKALEPNDKLGESTSKARALLDSYIARMDQLTLAKTVADAINSKISSLKIEATLATQNAISTIENEISNWIKKYQIDDANMSLVNDLTPTKKAYEKAVAELRTLYEAYKKAVESIGKVSANSKTAIDGAYKAYDAIKNYTDANQILSLKNTNTVESLYVKLQQKLDEYNYLVKLIDAIRQEIDKIHTADPEVTHDDISKLNAMVDELLKIETSINVINTEKTNYVSLLDEARLLPYKNEAFGTVKATYDECYARANNNRDIIISLVDIKDFTLNAIENAKSVDEINALVEKAKTDFANCFK